MMQILHRDPLHRTQGCWYIQNSRMLQHLDDLTVEATARQSAMATYSTGEFLHEAGTPMDAVTFISQRRRQPSPTTEPPVRRRLYKRPSPAVSGE